MREQRNREHAVGELLGTCEPDSEIPSTLSDVRVEAGRAWLRYSVTGGVRMVVVEIDAFDGFDTSAIEPIVFEASRVALDPSGVPFTSGRGRIERRDPATLEVVGDVVYPGALLAAGDGVLFVVNDDSRLSMNEISVLPATITG
ncbi:MAG: hypothetical protein AB8G14_05425 [Ilumatobacter sp.]